MITCQLLHTTVVSISSNMREFLSDLLCNFNHKEDEEIWLAIGCKSFVCPSQSNSYILKSNCPFNKCHRGDDKGLHEHWGNLCLTAIATIQGLYVYILWIVSDADLYGGE